MKTLISYPDLKNFKKLSYISYFLGFLPFLLVSIGSFFNPAFLFFMLFLSIPTIINFSYFIHSIQSVDLEMDNDFFYYQKNGIEHKISFSQIKEITNKHLPIKKWRKIIYYVRIKYIDKNLQEHSIYFLSTDQQKNYNWETFFSRKKEIPFVKELKEHINFRL